MSTFMKKSFFIVFIFSSAIFSVAANGSFLNNIEKDTDIFTEFDNSLGGFYGEVSGTGLSYQHWFGKVGIQTTFGLTYYGSSEYYSNASSSSQSQEHTIFNYNIGAEILYRVYSSSFTKWFAGSLYVFGGVKHIGSFTETYNYSSTATTDEYGNSSYAYTGTTGPSFTPVLNPGLGIGIELLFFQHFSIPLQIGVMGSWEVGTALPIDGGIVFECGLRYRF